MNEKTTDLEHVERFVEVPADVYGWQQLIKGALIAGIGYLPIEYHSELLSALTTNAQASAQSGDPVVMFGMLFAAGCGALVYGAYTAIGGLRTMFNANEIREKDD